MHISYPLQKTSPLYPGSPDISFEPVKSIANNDSSNTSLLSFGSHSGTHIDAPLHFSNNGCSISDTLESETVFSPAICIDLPKEPDSYIDENDLKPFEGKIIGAEALLIRTGFFRYRKTNQKIYTELHPWIHPNLAKYLRKTFPKLKIIGFDTISISNPSHRMEGRGAHKAFLCEGPPILLLEDANLSDKRLLDNKFDLLLYPWIIDELDGTPVTALVTFDQIH